MVGASSTLEPSPDGTTKKSIPRKIISLQQAPSHFAISKSTWITGTLFLLFLSVVLVAMIMNMRQTELSAMYQEIIGRIQMHSLRVANASQQAILGNEVAFTQLRDSREQLNQHITLLKQGGIHRNFFVAAITESPSAIILDKYHDQWLADDKKVNLILKNRNSLVRLGHVVNEINIANTQLLNLIDQLAVHIEEMGGMPNEMIAVKAMKVLTQSVEKSVNAVMPSEFPFSEISAQLIQDRKSFSLIINALNQGGDELQISFLEETDALKMLHQIQTLFHVIDNYINEFQEEIPGIITIQFAAQKLYGNNEIMLRSAATLEDTLREQKAFIISRLDTAIYTSGAFAVLAFILFCRSFTYHMHGRYFSNEKTFESTQKAIRRLLNEIDALTDGNLTVRTMATEDVTDAIDDSINHAVEKLHVLVEDVNQATIPVVESSRQAQIIAAKLLTAIQQQSQNIEETIIALLSISGSANEVSDTAIESAKIAKQSLAAVEKGAMAARDSVTGMNEIRVSIQETSKRIKRLGESSQEIGETVALIADITEQTNVLALNATLQAVSAGEAGHGFAVIAQEIKRLAERFTETSQQIDGLVKIIQSDTQDTIVAMKKTTFSMAEGAKRLRTADWTLKEIKDVSNHLEQFVAAISENTNTQARAVGRVVRNAEAILEITRKTTNDAMHNAQSIKQIAGFAAELEAFVSNFKR